MSKQIQQTLFSFSKELLFFTFKEARSCIFAGSFFILLFTSQYFSFFGLHQYDFLFLATILIQLVLFLLKLETKDEIKVIFIFHLLGFGLELFKTSAFLQIWTYLDVESAIFKFQTVPLYSGFMYSAVASYMIQCWRILKLKLTDYPPKNWVRILGVLIYLNFFTNAFVYDIRYFLVLAIFIIFHKSKVHFVAYKKTRWMPLILAFFLIGFFIWLAENMSTFLGAWVYLHQTDNWKVVNFEIIISWFLMVIVSFILVAE